MDWINVNRITPKPFVSVLCRMPGEKPFPTVHEGYISDDGDMGSLWIQKRTGRSNPLDGYAGIPR